MPDSADGSLASAAGTRHHRRELVRALQTIERLQEALATAGDRTTPPGSVAVTGIGCRFPGGVHDPESFWRLLCDGVDATGEFPAARADVGLAHAPHIQTAKLVLFQTLAGTRLAWQTVVMSSPAYLHVIDAQTGRVLFRKSLTDDANGSVFDYWPGAPLGGTQHVVDFTAPGWLAASREHRLQGNNTHVYTDVNDDNIPQSSEEVSAASDHSWNFPFQPFDTPAGGPPCVAWPLAQHASQVTFAVRL